VTDEELYGCDQDNGEHECNQVDERDTHAKERDPQVGVARRERPCIRSPDEQHDVLRDNRQAERCQQRRFVSPLHQGIEHPALDHVAEQEHDRSNQQHCQERIEAERASNREVEIGGQEKELPVNDVDKSHHPEDQRES
jgi:hypothetical protein